MWCPASRISSSRAQQQQTIYSSYIPSSLTANKGRAAHIIKQRPQAWTTTEPSKPTNVSWEWAGRPFHAGADAGARWLAAALPYGYGVCSSMPQSDATSIPPPSTPHPSTAIVQYEYRSIMCTETAPIKRRNAAHVILVLYEYSYCSRYGVVAGVCCLGRGFRVGLVQYVRGS